MAKIHASVGDSGIVLKIERVSDGQLIILRLSGRLQSEHVDQLKAHIASITPPVILDLNDVKLVDRDVVCFLGVCETNGIELTKCPLYIRNWINREKSVRVGR